MTRFPDTRGTYDTWWGGFQSSLHRRHVEKLENLMARVEGVVSWAPGLAASPELAR